MTIPHDDNAISDTQVLVRRVHNRHPAYFRRLQRFLRERNWVLVILDDVDLLSAQLANDRLHPHPLHAHAGADRVHVFVLRHYRDLGALARFPRNRPDHHRAVVNFRHLGLEQMLDQLRSRARGDHARAFYRLVHPCDHYPNSLADRERFQPRLLLAPHARFGLADVEDHIGPFDPLDRGIHDFVHMPDVFVVNRVAFRLAHLLEDDLLGQLRRNPPQNSFRHFRNQQLSARFRRRIQLARLLHRHLQVRVFHLLRSLSIDFTA